MLVVGKSDLVPKVKFPKSKSVALLLKTLGEVVAIVAKLEKLVATSSVALMVISMSSSASKAALKRDAKEAMQTMKMTARDVGATTKFSASEAAQGLDFLAMAGFNAQQSMAGLSCCQHDEH